MKLLRLWLLVFLAAAVPLRGAVAAAMLCAPAQAQEQLEHHAAAHDPATHGQAQALHHHSDTSTHDHEASGQGTQDKCDLCAAFCSLTPLPSASAGVPEPHGLSHTRWPDLGAPAPSFVSDGQERPPRSI